MVAEDERAADSGRVRVVVYEDVDSTGYQDLITGSHGRVSSTRVMQR
jgi:hypothetical protein